jgi:UDP-glucose 4-epimerase
MPELGAVGNVFNIGNHHEITIKNLAVLVKEMTGSASELIFMSYNKVYGPGFEDMKRRCPDISKVKNLINFEPRHNLESIIRSVIEYYEAQPL